MQPLRAARLLDVWEQGRDQVPAQRALALLAAASPDESLEALAALSIGQRNGRLLTLREWAFGPQLRAVIDCPRCSRSLEFAVRLEALRVDAPQLAPDSCRVDLDGLHAGFRVPNSADLLSIPASSSLEAARQMLLERCLVWVESEGRPLPAQTVRGVLADAVVSRMAQADPQADMRLSLACPACRHGWRSVLDIAGFFWTEIGQWAQRILRDVHALASAYHWREHDVLELSPWRRQAYLGLVVQ